MEITWGIISVIFVTAGLVAAIIIGVTLHSRKIKESEFKFRTLFEKVFDALLLIDEQGKIMDVNDSACQLSGYSKGQLLKMKISRLLPAKFAARLREIKNDENGENMAERLFFAEIELIKKDNTKVFVEVGVILIRIGGKNYTLASFRDIHSRKIAERDLDKKNVALKEILSHLEEKKRRFEIEISDKIDNTILPTFRRVVNEDGSVNLAYYEIIDKELRNLATSSGSNINRYSCLSPREVEICDLIKSGATSKEISSLLRISLITVNKHRENIRKKLRISNRGISLSVYLKES